VSARALLPLLAALALSAAPAAAQSHLLVVAGLGGEPQYSDAFHEWATSMADAAERRMGLPAERITVLTERPDRDPRRIDGRSSRDAVLQAIGRTARAAAPGDVVLLLLIGHGSAEGEVSRLNLPGPDLTAEDLAKGLDALAAQKVVVVNAASASGGFVERLSGRNRTVITATQSPLERNETRFGGYFVAAFTGEGADADKDGRVSMLEAFEFARREVEREYREGNRMLTEHALLDDDGDGKGSREPAQRSGDGAVARTLFLSGGARAAPASAADSPEVRALRERQKGLEAEVEALKARREGMDAAAYQRELERLLLEIARLGQQIRQRGGTR
jgi:hypothetical protein